MNSPHIPVLLDEVLDAFKDVSGLLVDCTLGYGGHSGALLTNNKNLNIIACDRDSEAIAFSNEKLAKFKERFRSIKSPFSQAFSKLSKNELASVRGVLADIGVSSLQIDKNERGFGLASDTLDMRMDIDTPLSAIEVVNEYPLAELERIFRDYGELGSANLLATRIINARAKEPIVSASRLKEVLGNARVAGRNVSVATLAFQAIRIEVNDELGELRRLLAEIEKLARSGVLKDCLVAIISFHSLEDRMVKETFKRWAMQCICDPQALRCVCGKNNAIGKVVSKKPIVASKSELSKNSRASSAKMRIFKIGGCK